MKEIKVFEEKHKKTWYTFEFENKEHVMTCSEWVNGKMMIYGLCENGRTVGMEMQYGINFTGSIDSIDDWFARKLNEEHGA